MSGCVIARKGYRRKNTGGSDSNSSWNVYTCPLADAEHGKALRQYAHTYHYNNTICVAHAFNKLPETHQLGILLHECGHQLAGPMGSESNANDAVHKATGIRVYYCDSEHGDELECIDSKDVGLARDYLIEVLE
jgi:hypothetical protein